MEFIKNKGSLEKVWDAASRKRDFRSRSNNWLKMHGRPMRRKPFKKINQCLLIDEMHLLIDESTANRVFFGLTGKGNPFFAKYQEYNKNKEEGK